MMTQPSNYFRQITQTRKLNCEEVIKQVSTESFSKARTYKVFSSHLE
uniref:Uncharacterized protein n=1 Tax=Rhizophora mucronata TaxID=61149 RepID=A0A2P2PYV1_RHIMU